MKPEVVGIVKPTSEQAKVSMGLLYGLSEYMISRFIQIEPIAIFKLGGASGTGMLMIRHGATVASSSGKSRS